MSEVVTAEAVQAQVSGLSLPMGLVIDRLEAVSGVFRIDPSEHRLDASPVEVVATISTMSLQRFLESQLPGFVTLSEIQFENQEIVVQAKAKVVFEVPFTAKFKLRIEEGREIWIETTYVDKPVPIKGVLDSQLAQMNPIFKVSDLPLPCALNSVDIEGDIRLFCTLTLPKTWEG